MTLWSLKKIPIGVSAVSFRREFSSAIAANPAKHVTILMSPLVKQPFVLFTISATPRRVPSDFSNGTAKAKTPTSAIAPPVGLQASTITACFVCHLGYLQFLGIRRTRNSIDNEGAQFLTSPILLKQVGAFNTNGPPGTVHKVCQNLVDILTCGKGEGRIKE